MADWARSSAARPVASASRTAWRRLSGKAGERLFI
jgi:hypothetical protein